MPRRPRRRPQPGPTPYYPSQQHTGPAAFGDVRPRIGFRG